MRARKLAKRRKAKPVTGRSTAPGAANRAFQARCTRDLRSSPVTLYRLAERVGAALKKRKLMLATAESCTGGWVSEAVTMVPGSSGWFERGFVTYTYISKREMLGVNERTLEKHGAVAEEIVREMVKGALSRSHAQVAVAVSGVAGPSGGTPEKPVGTVCFAWARKGGAVRSETKRYSGDREAVRRQSVEHALRGVLALLAPGGG